MMKEAARAVGAIASLPMGILARAFQASLTGPRVILDLRVRRWDDMLLRQAILHRLERALDDSAVVAFLLRLEAPPGSWAACEDLRGEIQKLRKKGKPVYAWVEQPGNALMWVASAADRVFLVPAGDVGLLGIAAELTFFGDLLGKMGLEADFEAAGTYKSFGEAYTRRFASPANQEAVRALVDDLQEQILAGIAEGRGLELTSVRSLLSRAPLSSAEALEAKLVDQVCYADEMEAWLKEKHGKEADLLSFGRWARRDAMVEWISRWGEGGGVVAILHLDGPIVMDDKGPGILVRARHVVTLLRDLQEDEEVLAVVLHVNTPGGSALASELLWREIDLIQKKKPVIACFEDVAASGGYYLAAPAAEIISRPSTLTGSIGVFGGKVVVSSGLRRVGVHAQEIASAPNAGFYSPTRHFSDDQRARFRASLQRFYDGFVDHVAAGRHKTVEAVEPHCRGRVWTGRAAERIGLVDRHGDLSVAVERARDLANLRPGTFHRRDLSGQPNRSVVARAVHAAVRSFLPGGATAFDSAPELVRAWLGDASAKSIELFLQHPEQPLAMLPFEVRIPL